MAKVALEVVLTLALAFVTTLTNILLLPMFAVADWS